MGAGTEQDLWQSATVEYNVEKVGGVLNVEKGTVLSVLSFTEFGAEEALSQSDYSVVFLAGNNSTSVTNTVNSVSGKAGDMPKNVANNYSIAIVDGYVDRTELGVTINSLADLQKIGSVYTEKFNIVEATSSFSEVTVTDADDKDVTEFTYKGDSSQNKVSFYINGEKADFAGVDDNDVNAVIVWDEYAGLAAPALDSGSDTDFVLDLEPGTYSGTVYGQGALKGEAKFSFEVAPLDLSKAVLTAKDLQATTGGTNANWTGASDLFVNGTQVDTGDLSNELSVELYKCALADGTIATTWTNMDAAGSYTYKVTKNGADPETDKDIIGAGYVTVNVYGKLVTDVAYGPTPLNPSAGDFGTFYASLGQAFDPSLITVEGKTTGFTYTVKNAEGEEFTGDWANLPAGQYFLTVTADAAADFSKGGSITDTFTVKASYVNYANATYFVSVDGKVKTSGDDIEYTGSAIVPTVIAKDADNNILKEGVDYTVELQDSKGNVVEGFTDVANGYKVVVEFADGTKDAAAFTLDIVPAVIRSIQPAADFFVTDGETAAVPAFEFSTNADFEKGQKVELSADQISVSYFEVTGKGTEDSPYAKDATKKVDANDLVEQKVYWAEVTVLSTVENYKTGTTLPGCAFEVRTDGGFVDVAPDAWYATVVKQAKDLEYMTGIAGTKLFLPAANITRAEVAQVFYNMAGGEDNTFTGSVSYGDVDIKDWYGPAILWASLSGVATGYDNGDFGPNDTATREQVATMIYRYMKAQGKDVSVDDQAAALAKYTDGASVSDYAKTAMAYCIEQGVFGVGVDTLRPQDNMARAEMAATAVRVQPEKLA